MKIIKLDNRFIYDKLHFLFIEKNYIYLVQVFKSHDLNYKCFIKYLNIKHENDNDHKVTNTQFYYIFKYL